MDSQGHVIGIDLGTTNSVVAVIENGEPQTIPNTEGRMKTPSVIGLNEDGQIVVGELARRQASTQPLSTISSVKRLIGRLYEDIVEASEEDLFPYELGEDDEGMVTVRVRERDYTPAELSAEILRKLKLAAEEYLGEEVGQAVVTVPAYFDDPQRQATLEAARLAGLEVLRLLNEPTAAAMAYGLGREGQHTVAVYDFGGGTFDFSVLDIDDKSFEVLVSQGDSRLGGDDLDDLLVQYMADRFMEETGIDLRGEAMTLRRLKEAAEHAKCELSSAYETIVTLPFIAYLDGQPRHLEMTLTRELFEDMIEPLVKVTLECCERALRAGKIRKKALTKVILVGGSTRIPLVQDMVEEFFNMQPFKGVNPDEVVAAGAATQGAVMNGILDEVVLLDVTPHSLGIEIKGNRKSSIIEKNSTIPIKVCKTFTTTEDDQAFVNIHALQGESENIGDCRSLGKFSLSGIEKAPAGVPRIRVTFFINADGIVEISAIDTRSGAEKTLSINHASLSNEERNPRRQEEKRRRRKRRRVSLIQDSSQRDGTLSGAPADSTGVRRASSRKAQPDGQDATGPRPVAAAPSQTAHHATYTADFDEVNSGTNPSRPASPATKPQPRPEPAPAEPVAAAPRNMSGTNGKVAPGPRVSVEVQNEEEIDCLPTHALAKRATEPGGQVQPEPQMYQQPPLWAERAKTELRPSSDYPGPHVVKPTLIRPTPAAMAEFSHMLPPEAGPKEYTIPQFLPEEFLDLARTLCSRDVQTGNTEAMLGFRDSFTQFCLEHPEDADLQLLLARYLVLVKQPEDSRALLQKIREAQPEMTSLILDTFGLLCDQFPNYIAARKDRAEIASISGEYELAMEDLEFVAERNDVDEGTLDRLSGLYQLMLSEQPDATIQFKMVKLYLRKQELDSAIGILQQLTMQPKYSDRANKVLGLCFWQKGMRYLAWQKFRGLAVDEEMKDILFRLAGDMEQCDELLHAKYALERIYETDIRYRDIEERLKKVSYRLELQKDERYGGIGASSLPEEPEVAGEYGPRFEVIQEINRGSMGVVYKARDMILDEIVAIKVLNDYLCADPQAVERFKKEARAARKLTHNNLVRIHDLFEVNSKKIISMEFIQGENMKTLLARNITFSEDMVLNYMVKICEGLAYAHRLQVVHRDIKPANIMITDLNEVKITDFGIAKLLTEHQTKSNTIVMGTPLYMAPEQIEGGKIDHRCDIYSLGIMLYELVVGRPPFYEGNIEYQHIHQPVPEISYGASNRLKKIITRCVEKNPQDRFNSVEEILTCII